MKDIQYLRILFKVYDEVKDRLNDFRSYGIGKNIPEIKFVESNVLCTSLYVVLKKEYPEKSLILSTINRYPGVVIYDIEESKDDSKSLYISPNGYMTIRSYVEDDVILKVPGTKDEYFNINLMHNIPLEFDELLEIKKFIHDNKECILSHSVLFEIANEI